MSRVLPVLFGLLVPVVPAPAQESRKVVVRSLCFQHVKGIEKVRFLREGSPTAEVPLWLREPSEDIVLEVGGDTLLFCEPGSGDGEKPRIVARGTIGDGGRHLLFFVPSGEEPAIYQVFSFPDDQRSFPMGATRLLNLATMPAVFRMGERSARVSPGRSKVVPMPGKVNEYNDYNLEIKLETPRGIYPVRQTRGRAVRTKRDMAVVWLDPATKRARVNLYTDIPPWTLPRNEPR